MKSEVKVEPAQRASFSHKLKHCEGVSVSKCDRKIPTSLELAVTLGKMSFSASMLLSISVATSGLMKEIESVKEPSMVEKPYLKKLHESDCVKVAAAQRVS
jgi:hypothetical protein